MRSSQSDCTIKLQRPEYWLEDGSVRHPCASNVKRNIDLPQQKTALQTTHLNSNLGELKPEMDMKRNAMAGLPRLKHPFYLTEQGEVMKHNYLH